MMCLKQALLIIPLIIYYVAAATTTIYFSKCSVGGFTCIIVNGKHRITYQCPATANDVAFYVWDFRAPVNTERLEIKNCKTLRLSFRCSGSSRPITDLVVANITNLYFIKSLLAHSPYNTVFTNITYIDYIPENTFSQIKTKSYRPGCAEPIKDLQNLYFNRVNIGTIAPKAFSELKDFYNFSWNQVKVQRIQHSAVHLEFNKAGNFSIRKSNLEVLEHLAFRTVGKYALFVENKFVEIFSGAINGTIEKFTFNINSVNNLQSYGISILSETVQISDNRFEYLRSGAFEKISPGLLQNSQRNFGNLKFTYEFSHNYVNFMDAGSLNPDIAAYDNVATDLKFFRNALFCSCENLGWLWSDIGHGYNTALLKDFYETIIDEGYKNICAYTSCELSLQKAGSLVEKGKCMENLTAEILCDRMEEMKENFSTTTAWILNFTSEGSLQFSISTFSIVLTLPVTIYFL